ncbi:MAG: hypothetical protein IPM51_15080 [Sphingobacteriaceae bacterium]|nr:hypothetical protein [Sphingobacteriaceae bacterium]
MKPTNILFELVHSLSASEESYFKELASLQHGDKNYLKIYTYLKSLKEYDEVEVKKHFKNEVFVKHFPSEKNQLLHHILRSLRNHRFEKNQEAIINEQIKNIQILFNKSLFRMARRELNRIKITAYKNEFFYSVLKIIELEKVVIDIEVRFDENDMRELDMLMTEKEELLKKISNLIQLDQILAELILQYNQHSFVKNTEEKNKLETLLKNKKLFHAKNILSKKARITALLIQCLALRLLHKEKELLRIIPITIKMMEEEGFYINENPNNYILCYSFLARSYALNQQYNESYACLDKIKAQQLSPEFEPLIYQIEIFTRSVINDSMFLLYTGKFEEHGKSIPFILSGLKKYQDKMPSGELSTIHYLLFMSYFGRGEYQTGLSWLNKIINSKEKLIRPDLYRICKLVNLIMHFELNNISLINYLFKSNQRYYEVNKQIFPFEKIFMKYFRKFALKEEGQHDLIHLEKMKQEIMVAFQDPYQKFALEYFDFEAWINSKLHNISFKQALINSRHSG